MTAARTEPSTRTAIIRQHERSWAEIITTYGQLADLQVTDHVGFWHGAGSRRIMIRRVWKLMVESLGPYRPCLRNRRLRAARCPSARHGAGGTAAGGRRYRSQVQITSRVVGRCRASSTSTTPQAARSWICRSIVAVVVTDAAGDQRAGTGASGSSGGSTASAAARCSARSWFAPPRLSGGD